MVSSTFLHIAIDWDELDPLYKFVTMDCDGLYAHETEPYIERLGHYESDGQTKYLGPTHLVVFGRDSVEPLTIATPKDQEI